MIDRETLTLTDGRVLSYAEYGASPRSNHGFNDQATLLYLHGMPSSAAEAGLWHSTACSLQIRLVATDRPGLGGSTGRPSRTVLDYPSDIVELACHLELGSFSILGVSGGGAYALACAFRKKDLPGLLRVVVVVGLPPRDLSFSGMSLSQRFAFLAMAWVPGSLVGWLWDAMIGKTARDPDAEKLKVAVRKSFEKTAKTSKVALPSEEFVSTMTDALRGAFAQNSQGYVHDATLATTPWQFNLADINDVDVRLWYGGKDTIAPSSSGRAIAARVPGASCVVFLEEDHTGVVMNHQSEILRALKQGWESLSSRDNPHR
ncbi:hypothetical protein ANO11243_034700 [Dothideomycetidae sp. 11243]|nr:hypothetical protein ANO11243_034700 [fungal sp. No.11243]